MRAAMGRVRKATNIDMSLFRGCIFWCLENMVGTLFVSLKLVILLFA